MSNVKHTSTPWAAEVDASDKYSIKNERRWVIPGVAGSIFSGADAQHIVKCVNAHAALVDALKHARQRIGPDEKIDEALAELCK